MHLLSHRPLSSAPAFALAPLPSRLQTLAPLSLALSLALGGCGGGKDSQPPPALTSFSMEGVSAIISGTDITVDLSALQSCAQLASLTASVALAQGVSISPDPAQPRDYRQPVNFTFTAADGVQTSYSVTVKAPPCSHSSSRAAPRSSAPPSTPSNPAVCNAPAYPATGYSLVFKGCDGAGAPTYYDKSECVRDNSQRLIWMGQTAPGSGLRASDRHFTHYTSTTELQKYIGREGGVDQFGAPSQADIDSPNNSVGFARQVNDSRLCGLSGWRLPAPYEWETQNASPDWADWYVNHNDMNYYWVESRDDFPRGIAAKLSPANFWVFQRRDDPDGNVTVRLVYGAILHEP